MTEIVLIYIVLFIVLEIFESSWQKSDSFYGLLKNNYQLYKKSLVLYIFFNPTFIYAIYLAIALNNYSFMMNCIIVLKFVDISFRLHLCRKIENDEDIGSLIPNDIQYNVVYRYINVLIYPLTFYFAMI